MSLFDLPPVYYGSAPRSPSPRRFDSPKRCAAPQHCPPTPDRTPPPMDLRNRAGRKHAKHHLTTLKVALGLPPLVPTADSPDLCELILKRPLTPTNPCCGPWAVTLDVMPSPGRAGLYADELDLRNPFSPIPCSEVSNLSSIGAGSGPGSDERAQRSAFLVRAHPSVRLSEDFDDVVSIGAGETSEVYKARSRLTGLMYSIKVKKHHSRGAKERENLLQEVYALSVGYHPHIIRYHHSWMEEDSLYIVAEYCSGGSVSSEAWGDDQPLRSWPEADLVELLRHVADALAFLHAHNMAHLDLKMDNVFVATEGVDLRVYKLGDFGLVRMIDGDVTQFDGLNESEGDSRYVDCYLLNSSEYLREADVFSLGASIYELARGRPLPTQGPEWTTIRGGNLDLTELQLYSPGFLDLLRAMLHPDPVQRPSAFDVYRFAVRASPVPNDQLQTEVALLRAEAELLRGQLATLQRLRAAEERRSSRRGSIADSVFSDVL